MMEPLMKPPPQQAMSAALQVLDGEGLVLRQSTQVINMVTQALDLPFEQQNVYYVSALPAGRSSAAQPTDPARWQPSLEELKALPAVLLASEESSLGCRMGLACAGLLNLRAFKMHFLDPNSGQELLLIDRPFRCGGALCQPLEMSVSRGGQPLGSVVEDFDNYASMCWAACCLCTNYNRVQGAGGEHRYTLRINKAWCGPSSNCCGATPCRNDAVFDVLDPQGKVVGHIQKTYGGGSATGLLRCMSDFSNYILSFPAGATPEDKALLLASLIHVEYQSFERQGNENNN